MLDTSHDLNKAAEELGCPVEQLLTPLTRFKPQNPLARFAIDNGAYSSFDADSFTSLLKREDGRRELCRFVAVPDVVGSARRTLEVFAHWRHEACLRFWPLALVAQDGQEDLPIPWDDISAIFIGGTGGEKGWKSSEHVSRIIKAAKALGKWVHVGRVNSPGRFEHFEQLGADSLDGSGLAQYTHMREKIYNASIKPPLFREPTE